MTNNLTATLC